MNPQLPVPVTTVRKAAPFGVAAAVVAVGAMVAWLLGRERTEDDDE